MSLPATDNFNRGAQANLGANWTDQNGQLVTTAGNQCKGTTQVDYNAAYWSADVFPDTQWSRALAATGNTGYAGVMVRASGTEAGGTRTAYYLLWGVDLARITKVVNTTITDLVTPGSFADPATNDDCMLLAEGTTLTAYYNDVQVAQVTDSSISSGSAGVIIYNDLAALDDWRAGTIEPPPAMFPLSRRTLYHYRRDVFRRRIV